MIPLILYRLVQEGQSAYLIQSGLTIGQAPVEWQAKSDDRTLSSKSLKMISIPTTLLVLNKKAQSVNSGRQAVLQLPTRDLEIDKMYI